MNNKKEEFSVNDFENFLKIMKETDESNPSFEAQAQRCAQIFTYLIENTGFPFQ
jgi:hypothetical protein